MSEHVTELEKALMDREGWTQAEAQENIFSSLQQYKDNQQEGLSQDVDLEEVLEEEFGLEPDYIFDLLHFWDKL